MANDTLDFKVNDEWAKAKEEAPWLAFVPAFATGSDGTEFVRGVGRQAVYRIVNEDAEGRQSYQCNTCDADIKAATVAHPIWDGPGPCSGSGEVNYESVPYCANCETEPSFHGSPIRD